MAGLYPEKAYREPRVVEVAGALGDTWALIPRKGEELCPDGCDDDCTICPVDKFFRINGEW